MTVTLGECMCSWPSHTPLTIHLSMSGWSPLFTSSCFNASLSSIVLSPLLNHCWDATHTISGLSAYPVIRMACGLLAHKRGLLEECMKKGLLVFPQGHIENVMFQMFTCRDHKEEADSEFWVKITFSCCGLYPCHAESRFLGKCASCRLCSAEHRAQNSLSNDPVALLCRYEHEWRFEVRPLQGNE